MKIPNQSSGIMRTVCKVDVQSGINPAQFRVVNFPAPRPCDDCDLLYLACRAADEPDCAEEYLDCRTTCTGPITTLPVAVARRNTSRSLVLHMQLGLKGEDVGDRKCSLVRTDGSIHFGLCKNVCKGKDVTKDAGGNFGGDYYCKQSAILGTALDFPVIIATQY